jgi:HSP20 family protein
MTSLAPRRSRQFAAQPRRGDPQAEIEQLRDRMGDLLQTFFTDPFSTTTVGALPAWMPPVDIEETDDAYVAEMDLPSVRAEEINLELRGGNELRIIGEYREREHTGMMRRQNRRTGQFEYLVTLPGEVDPNKIDAMLDNGVLTVHLAKSAAGQPRRIEIKGGGQSKPQPQSQSQSRGGHGRQSRGA